MSELNRKKLMQLLEKTENSTCADCGDEKPDWGSYNIGVFLCNSCASIHRGLGAHISRVKSVKLDNWDRTQYSCMEEIGNERARTIYEMYLPIYYRRPKPGDPAVVREQWIRAKYERKEFAEPVTAIYSKGDMEGFLMKRGKEDGKYHPRKFFLEFYEGIIKYYVKQSDKKPKASINVVNLNLSFSPQKIHPNGLQFTYLKDGATRSIYVYSEDAKTIIDWFTAIRAAKLHHMQIAFPTSPVEELAQYLTRDFIIEGYLDKTGPRSSDAFRRRYCVLDERNLMYFDHPMDPYPNNEILLGEMDEGFAVAKGIDGNLKSHENGFMLTTPDRVWLFGAPNEEERDAWIAAIKSVIEKTPVAEDFTSVNLRKELRNSYTFKKNRHSGGVKSSSSGSNNSSGHDSFMGTLKKGKNALLERVTFS